jgi:hypothetical protein
MNRIDQVRCESRWLDYAWKVLIEQGGLMTCCITGASNEVQRWTGCLGANYGLGRVLMVGAVHNKPVLEQDKAPLALAAKTWVDSGRSGANDGAYLAAVRDFYRRVAPTWEYGGTVWRTFAKIRERLNLRSEEVAYTNVAKCEMRTGFGYGQLIRECLHRFPLNNLVEAVNPAIVLVALSNQTYTKAAGSSGIVHDGKRVFQYDNMHLTDPAGRLFEVWIQDAKAAYVCAMGKSAHQSAHVRC